jgi:hypothetical protein
LKLIFAMIPFMFTLNTFAQNSAAYAVLKGQFHQTGKVVIAILPDTAKYKVQMNYEVIKKAFVPVPARLLKGKTIMEFPDVFRTEVGYQALQQHKEMEIPKARLKFVKRGNYKNLANAYFIEVHPINKKTKIDIIYHPSLPSVGWARVKITFLSKIPVLNGYELAAEIK